MKWGAVQPTMPLGSGMDGEPASDGARPVVAAGHLRNGWRRRTDQRHGYPPYSLPPAQSGAETCTSGGRYGLPGWTGNNTDADDDRAFLVRMAHETGGQFSSAHSFGALCQSLRRVA